jgi:hypothetical protein
MTNIEVVIFGRQNDYEETPSVFLIKKATSCFGSGF